MKNHAMFSVWLGTKAKQSIAYTGRHVLRAVWESPDALLCWEKLLWDLLNDKMGKSPQSA